MQEKIVNSYITSSYIFKKKKKETRRKTNNPAISAVQNLREISRNEALLPHSSFRVFDIWSVQETVSNERGNDLAVIFRFSTGSAARRNGQRYNTEIDYKRNISAVINIPCWKLATPFPLPFFFPFFPPFSLFLGRAAFAGRRSQTSRSNWDKTDFCTRWPLIGRPSLRVVSRF